MSSSSKSHKKSTKAVKVEIKPEIGELHPLSYYVDDRVELVKQIFSALKGKTIRNLAPDSVKKSSIEEIEELCLNELLGLSTKRLLSIISATKCPTDTESSSDSDVHRIEEHVSLEEISSDSEADRKHQANKPKGTKKLRKKEQGKTVNDKGVSVLELLELQARARAIRSQLALEPVAKIEVDSDDSQDESRSQAASKKAADENQQSTSRKKTTEKPTASTKDGKTTKRIKLKRNFRKPNLGDENGSKNSNEKNNGDASKLNTKEPKEDKSGSPKKTAEMERSVSPDVVTILPSPETFFISDSSDEEDAKKDTINEGEKSDQAGNEKIDFGIPTEGISENAFNNKEIADGPKDGPSAEEETAADDIEDGEIVDLNDSTKKDATNNNQAVVLNDEETEKNREESNETKETQLEQLPVRQVESSHNESSNDSDSDSSKQNSEKHNSDSEADRHTQNDDAISLNHEDLDIEASESKAAENQLPEPSISGKARPKPDENIDADIITLDNSSDDEASLDKFTDSNQSESWNCRWLRSDRVSKILATSRLGNRVRDKIKKSKQQIDSTPEEPALPEPPLTEVFQSKYEDGSLQQYAEILERERSNQT